MLPGYRSNVSLSSARCKSALDNKTVGPDNKTVGPSAWWKSALDNMTVGPRRERWPAWACAWECAAIH